MQTRPFLRTSSKPQLIRSGYHERHEIKATPQHVVIGFHLVSEDSKGQENACDNGSGRSVLEPCAHLRSPRSPQSVLGCLFSGRESHFPVREGVGLGVVAAITAEEVRAPKPSQNFSMISKPIAISVPNENVGSCSRDSCGGGFEVDQFVFHGGVMRDDGFDDFDVDEPHVTCMQESIFCAASPFSTCCSLECPGHDFLSVCFFCKCNLSHGKDVYIYKGDKAFCSSECRYQQIVIDECKERQLASANCYVGASTQNTKMFAGASAAIA